ncbi:glycosyltransferase family 4 protein [Glutamicibacter protophormiae]|uniref:glycosyltransferase family 4 protein n=1 Tax=Glutamicibacter protophormiae TaxID=37930 RepID=UPI001956AD16|nr:glycosyltransferase [Glutamicibacter protophormiae]QRQ79981.1 glycosyltransferase [Glutamicibacter protophormiae]
MKRILTTYMNCSLGGMTSVYRGRCLHQPDVQFDHVFEFDRGGRDAFAAFPNATVRVIPGERTVNYFEFLLAQFEYQQLRITSRPELVNKLNVPESTSVIYEFHSPHPSIVTRELKTLDMSRIDEIWTPSDWASELVRSLLPARKHATIRTVPNLVDTGSFRADARGISPLDKRPGQKPVSWIGRLENTQKNYLDFLRILKLLPEDHYGVVIFSLEQTPDRLERFLGDAAMLGVLDRLEIYGNVPQMEVASTHRAVRDAGGVFCSTALNETFGYAVLEAALTGCPVVSYDVGPLAEHAVDMRLTPVGDLLGTARAILELTSAPVVAAGLRR